MKKLLLYFVACFFVVGDAFAECKLMSCDAFSWYEPNGYMKVSALGNQCYGCGLGPDSCGNGDVVPFIDEDNEIVSLWECTFGFSFGFENVDAGNTCEDTPVKYSVENSKTIYKPVGQKTQKTDVGDLKFFSGTSFCRYIYCLDGYMPSEDKKSCIRDNRKEKCISSGGTWNNNKCFCMADKGLEERDSSGVCTCVNAPDYEYSATDGKCVKTQAAREREEEKAEEAREREAAAAVEANKRKCETSGGTWSGGKCSCDAAKNLRTENGVCVCTDSNYKRDGDRCVLTDLAALQKECLTDDSKNSGAWWDSVSKQCKCSNPRHVWMGTCVENPAILSCNKISGAQWNELEQKCSCIDPNKTINSTGTECVLTQEAVISISISSSKTKISNAVAKLNKIASDFNTSVWKNAEGEFNTSRLISDSVAGVVLGTAGGLITSSVVKKNQVESGFEDIQCTVGGQVVAGWGDQFRVGIQ